MRRCCCSLGQVNNFNVLILLLLRRLLLLRLRRLLALVLLRRLLLLVLQAPLCRLPEQLLVWAL